MNRISKTRNLNRARLETYLAWALEDEVRVREVSTLKGQTHENILVLMDPVNGMDCLLVRKMPAHQASGSTKKTEADDIVREFHVLKDLESVKSPTPRVWGLDETGTYLGMPCFAREYVIGPTVWDVIEGAPDLVLQGFVEAIHELSQITPSHVPSLSRSRERTGHLGDPLTWLRVEAEKIPVPRFWQEGMECLKRVPIDQWPQAAFGTGDLRPQNFIYKSRFEVVAIDWARASFSNPVGQLMCLHAWPEDEPFLKRFPLDRMYCALAGLDPRILWHHELYAALAGWISATCIGDGKRAPWYRDWSVRLIESGA